MRFPLKKLLGTVAVICILGLLSISGILRPLNKQDSENNISEEIQLPEPQSRRMPLVMTGNGPGSPEAAEKNVSESDPTSNFTRKQVDVSKNIDRKVPVVSENIEENVSKIYYERKLDNEIEKQEMKAKKAKTRSELQKSVQKYIQEKKPNSSTAKVKNIPVSPKPSLSPIKDDPTDKQSRRLSKIMKRVNITYDDPKKYKGPHVEGWPPGKDRYMPNYIKPKEDTFSLRPSKAHFKGCEILVIIHSAIDAFGMRMGVRDTWIQFVTQKKVANVSVIFLIGNQNANSNLTAATRQRVLDEHAKYDDILQANMVDHYNNLTLKSVFTLKFFLNESNFDSPPPFHVMKIDNDAYLNLPQLKFILKDKKLQKSPMYLVGHRYGTRKKPPQPIRLSRSKSKQKSKSKWWVPRYLYNGSRYPVILGGSGYVTTRPAAKCLFNESMKLPFFHLEDVFLTGFAAENCAIPRFHTDGFHPNAVHFADLKEEDILWHYLNTKSVTHMHRIFMYNDLLREHQNLKRQNKKLISAEKDSKKPCDQNKN